MPIELDELLETIDAPAPRPGFRDRVYEIAADRDNRAARRARVAVLALVTVGVAALSTTAVFGFGLRNAASGAYDKTYSCPVPVIGGVPVLHFEAGGGWLELALPAYVGDRHQLFSAAGSHPGGVAVDTKWCKPAAQIPLARGKLRSLGTFGRNDGLNYRDGDRCFSGARIVFRLHAVLKSGSVTRAQFAVETGTRLHPFIYADWTGTRTRVWGSDACSPEQ